MTSFRRWPQPTLRVVQSWTSHYLTGSHSMREEDPHSLQDAEWPRRYHTTVFHLCQQGLASTSFQPGTVRSLGCASSSTWEGFATLYCSQGTCQCVELSDPPLGVGEQPRPPRTSVLDQSLWAPPPVPGRTTTHSRLKRSGNQLALFKKGQDED